MIYLLFTTSLACNGILVWYIRKLLKKYWFDVDAREKFSEMLGQYEESLKTMYKLEELYGEEIIKKAITQTQFVIEACKEFQETISVENSKEQDEDDTEKQDENTKEDNRQDVIVLKEGEKISQKAANYKKIVLGD